MDSGGVDSDSEKHVTPAAKAVEPGCPICLESFEDKAFVDVCFHILFDAPFDIQCMPWKCVLHYTNVI